MTPDDYSDYFANTFRNFCIKAAAKNQLKAAQIAQVTGLSKSYVNKILNPNVQAPQPTVATMTLLCSALGFPVAKVLHSIVKHMPNDPVEQLRMRPAGWKPASEQPVKAMIKPRVRAPQPLSAKAISDDDGFALIDSTEL